MPWLRQERVEGHGHGRIFKTPGATGPQELRNQCQPIESLGRQGLPFEKLGSQRLPFESLGTQRQPFESLGSSAGLPKTLEVRCASSKASCAGLCSPLKASGASACPLRALGPAPALREPRFQCRLLQDLKVRCASSKGFKVAASISKASWSVPIPSLELC